MRKFIVGATMAVVLMIGVLALIGFGQNTQAGGSSVDETGIDMDPTGNTSTSVGTIETSLSNVALNTPVVIDVFVKGVPSDGLFGVGYVLNYDPAIIKITATTMTTTNPSNVLQFSTPPANALVNASDIDNTGVPDEDGALRVDSVGAGAAQQETGSGRVTAVTLECVAAGSSNLTITDFNTGGGDKMGVLYAPNGGGNYTVDVETEGSIGCGTGVVTPTATPVTTPTDTPLHTPTDTPIGITRVWGDWDCDGEISTRDNQALLRRVLTQAALSQTEPCPDLGSTLNIDSASHIWGDSDCDGEISTRDNQALLRRVLTQAALSQTEPCPDLGNSVQASE